MRFIEQWDNNEKDVSVLNNLRIYLETSILQNSPVCNDFAFFLAGESFGTESSSVADFMGLETRYSIACISQRVNDTEYITRVFTFL